MARNNRDSVFCSFCGRTADEAPQMIASPTGVHICADCVQVCDRMLGGKTEDDTEPQEMEGAAAAVIPELDVPKPTDLKDYLDEYVVGQDYVKRILSVAVHNHYKRLQHQRETIGTPAEAEVEIEKSNIVLIGPTGSGKTLLARTLARCLDVPFAITDATTLTEAGYVGEDVENILLRLVQAADYDIERTQVGIIYVDEIDKISRRTDNVSITRDVSGEGVQQALLKILEGTVANVPPKGGRKHPQQEYLKIDTSNILFICAGAFVGLDKMIRRRVGKRVLGFAGGAGEEDERHPALDAKDVLAHTEPEDLIKYGLIPEFIGRLPVVANLQELTEADLIAILTDTRNAITKQYHQLLKMEGVDLIFENSALHALARRAIERGTGARGLRAILEHLMVDIMYEIPSRRDIESCTITADVVTGKAAPMLKLKAKQKARKSA